MTQLLSCTVPGTPQAQGSKRSLGLGRPFIETNKHLAPWRADAIASLRAEWGSEGPYLDAVKVSAVFVYQRPKSHYRTGRNAHLLRDDAPIFKTSAPDLDKLQRALGDALTQAGVLRDDALIVQWGRVSKIWGLTPETRLSVRTPTI